MKRSELFVRALILPLDYIAIVSAFVVAYFFRANNGEIFLIPFGEFLLLILLLSLLWLICYWIVGVYSLELTRNPWEEFFALIIGSLAATTLTSSFIFFLKETDFSRVILVITTVMGILLALVVRILRTVSMRLLYRRGIGVKRILVIGEGESLQITLSGLEAVKDRSIRVVDAVSVADFNEAFDKYHPDEVIQSNPDLTNQQVADIIDLCEERGAIFRFVPNFFERPAAKIITNDLAGIPLVTLSLSAVDGWYAILKRLLDVLGAGLGVLILSPLFLIVAISIKLDSDGPVLFKQKRVGRNGREFELYKFRSMGMVIRDGKSLHAEANTQVEALKESQKNYKLQNDPRITRVGHFLRKASIDELPQLINVLRGELSLVGPRAYLRKELDSQLEKFPEAEGMVRRLTTVRPGITGLWQVSGRSNIEFSERVSMDAYYATNANVLLDLKILFQTLPVVLKGTGAM